MSIFYTLGVLIYRSGIGIASIFHAKARLWIAGRRGWEGRLRAGMGDAGDWIWFHCSSLGEFEQGRPLIEAIKKEHPGQKILLSFFSPSGYEPRKGYPHADHICYLPLDTPGNARMFLDIVRPRLAVFVKYDLWLNFIHAAHSNGVPLVLISALVRKDSRFLNSVIKNAYRKAFAQFSWIFTQDAESAGLIGSFAGIHRISVAGDTRFDRAAELPQKFQPLPLIERFISGRRCIIAGSTWPDDEAIILPVIEEMRRNDLCWILAPHETHPRQIGHRIANSPGRMARYSELEGSSSSCDVLWIDNIGMLSTLYHYGDLAYIGGGFGRGIHNTQEAAVYGNPVIFGPNHSRFQEAVDMVGRGGAKSVSTAQELHSAILHWLDNPSLHAATRLGNISYMQSKKGATKAILAKLNLLGYLNPAPKDQERSL
ncbi:MAG: hypothetical protein RLZZ165_1100 [Bacteroidota bacterium]